MRQDMSMAGDSMDIAEMKIEDYDEVSALWAKSEGVGLDPDDTRDGIGQYLGRNPGLSFVATRW